jgi:putative PIN family toxin of toxin-antitoxin system
MLVVLDTNVFFSALISPKGTPHEIYLAWRMRRFELVTSQKQLDELRLASRYPKFKSIFHPALVGTLINNMRNALVLEHLKIQEETNDPDDAFLLSMALAGKADYLVTGDRRAGLLERGHIGRTRITTPNIFCSEAL